MLIFSTLWHQTLRWSSIIKKHRKRDFTPELEQCRTELWSVLHPYQMKLIRMSPAAFIHFGTTKELRELMTERMDEFYYLGWTSNINTNREEADFAASNSYVSPNAEIGKEATWKTV